MYVAQVATNETCNQNCGFCVFRRSEERPTFARASAVFQRVDDACSKGAREIVLTGGEPTLRRDLPLIVQHAKRRGAAITLETNGALVDAARAKDLANAGLDLARVHVPLWGDEADAISRDEGGFRRTLRGLEAL